MSVKPFDHRRPQQRLVGLLQEPLFERDQATQQVAAIHGRKIPRRQRLQRAGVVPVVEVAPVFFQPVKRVEGVLEPLEQDAQADVTQVVGGQGRDEQEPDVGRRGAVRDPAVRDLLKVVRREPVIVVADKGGEKVPGLACDPAQGAAFVVGQVRSRPLAWAG